MKSYVYLRGCFKSRTAVQLPILYVTNNNRPIKREAQYSFKIFYKT